MQIWKSIEGFNNKYEISTEGRVKNKKTDLILKYYVDQSGYRMYQLYEKGNYKPKKKRASRLVGTAFIPNIRNKPEINHIDCNRLNDNVYNLEWVTRQENIRHSIMFGGLGKIAIKSRRQKISKLTYKQACEIKRIYKRNSREFGQLALAKKYNVCQSTISGIIRGKYYTEEF